MAKLEFDEALVRRLSELLEETGLTEIEYEAEGRRVRVARNAFGAIVAPALDCTSRPLSERLLSSSRQTCTAAGTWTCCRSQSLRR